MTEVGRFSFVYFRPVCPSVHPVGRLSMSLVMEYLPFGSLIVYLENNRPNVNTRRMLLFASQICKVGDTYMVIT